MWSFPPPDRHPDRCSKTGGRVHGGGVYEGVTTSSGVCRLGHRHLGQFGGGDGVAAGGAGAAGSEASGGSLAVGAPSFAGESLTWLLNSLVMPKVSTSFSIRRVETPEQVAGRHHRRQRPFGALEHASPGSTSEGSHGGPLRPHDTLVVHHVQDSTRLKHCCAQTWGSRTCFRKMRLFSLVVDGRSRPSFTGSCAAAWTPRSRAMIALASGPSVGHLDWPAVFGRSRRAPASCPTWPRWTPCCCS